MVDRDELNWIIECSAKDCELLNYRGSTRFIDPSIFITFFISIVIFTMSLQVAILLPFFLAVT